jgi:hypothetical protein
MLIKITLFCVQKGSTHKLCLSFSFIEVYKVKERNDLALKPLAKRIKKSFSAHFLVNMGDGVATAMKDK